MSPRTGRDGFGEDPRFADTLTPWDLSDTLTPADRRVILQDTRAAAEYPPVPARIAVRPTGLPSPAARRERPHTVTMIGWAIVALMAAAGIVGLALTAPVPGVG